MKSEIDAFYRRNQILDDAAATRQSVLKFSGNFGCLRHIPGAFSTVQTFKEVCAMSLNTCLQGYGRPFMLMYERKSVRNLPISTYLGLMIEAKLYPMTTNVWYMRRRREFDLN